MEDDLLNQGNHYDTNSSQSLEIGMEVEFEKENAISFPWSNLPSLAVEKIYTFLSREDQSRMSQVCRNWNQEYNSPRLWRSFKFYLSDRPYNPIEVPPEITIVRKFGHMFQDVQIIASNIQRQFPRITPIQLQSFLQALAFHSHLLSISFIDLNRYIDEDLCPVVCRSIVDLLLTQNKLQAVKFVGSEFSLTQAAEIAKTIFLKNSGTLKMLFLDGFIMVSSDDEDPDEVIDVPLTFNTLFNLKILSADYTKYFEGIIIFCYEYGRAICPSGRKGDLETIKLTCYGYEYSGPDGYQQIPPVAWEYMRKLFPALRINLSFIDGHINENNFDMFLVRHMPVRELDFKFKATSRNRRRTEIGEVFRHITSCEINECLEILSVSGLTNTSNFAPDLLNFLQLCPKLKVLKLYVERPVEALDTVFQYWLESGRKSLEIVHITISNVESTETASNYANLEDHYGPVLQVMGLNLILIVDSTRRSIRNRF